MTYRDEAITALDLRELQRRRRALARVRRRLARLRHPIGRFLPVSFAELFRCAGYALVLLLAVAVLGGFGLTAAKLLVGLPY